MNDDTKQPTPSPIAYMHPQTRRKWQKLAELDRRSLVDTYDVYADAELLRRGIDSKTLEPTDQPVEATP